MGHRIDLTRTVREKARMTAAQPEALWRVTRNVCGTLAVGRRWRLGCVEWSGSGNGIGHFKRLAVVRLIL